MTVLSPSEDLRDWVVDNWFTVKDCIIEMENTTCGIE